MTPQATDARNATANDDVTVAPNDVITACACPAHIDDPSTCVTAIRHRRDANPKHGAHQPNGSPAPRSFNGTVMPTASRRVRIGACPPHPTAATAPPPHTKPSSPPAQPTSATTRMPANNPTAPSAPPTPTHYKGQTEHMPWSTTRPRSTRYGREHRAERDRHMRALQRAGAGLCAERRCVKRSRIITPDMDLHLAHDPTGTIVLGLAHAACNIHEAAVRANRLRQQRPTRYRRMEW
jgi:hypothetical protein